MLGPRILYRDMASHEASFRMKQDEQQHATELQRRCLMRLPLLNLQDWGHHLSSPIGSHVLLGQVDNKYNINENDNPIHLEDVTFRGLVLGRCNVLSINYVFSESLLIMLY